MITEHVDRSCRRVGVAWVFVMAAFLASGIDAGAQGTSGLRISAQRKRVEKKEEARVGETVTREKWIYQITFENTGFKEMTDLVAKYRIYRLNDEHGAARGEMTLASEQGEIALGTLRSREKKTVDTKPMEIETLALKSGWTYRDGSKHKVEDRVKGFWVKVFRGEELIEDYANPSTLRKADNW